MIFQADANIPIPQQQEFKRLKEQSKEAKPPIVSYQMDLVQKFFVFIGYIIIDFR